MPTDSGGINAIIRLNKKARAKYRPDRITVLFVGESAPASGEFFYHGNSTMVPYMDAAVAAALGVTEDDIRSRFKRYGWYLDDLVTKPVNKIKDTKQRAELCSNGGAGLARRIAEYQPLAVVSLLRSIEPIVKEACQKSAPSAQFYGVPFPGNGWQAQFHALMQEIIPKLPRSPEN